jgi:TatD DNase family protein
MLATAPPPPHIFDSHCHLDDSSFDPDRAQVLARARAAGVVEQLLPAVRASDWPRLLGLCERESGLYPALGLHPIYSAEHTEADLVRLSELLRAGKARALGEIGLDFFIPEPERERQILFFREQLQLACDYEVPIILHVRKAHNETLALLKAIRPPRGGIAHAFNGSLELAREYMALGFLLGFGGMLTFDRSRKLRTLAAQLPEEVLALETDAPDMTVASHKGERNSPEYLPECLEALAEIRGVDAAHLAQITRNNVRRLLGLPDV